MSLYKTSHYNYRYSAHRLLKDWRENLVTWDKYATAHWSSPGASGIGSDISQLADGEGAVAWAPGWLNINVTNGVQLMSTNGNNFGWRLVGISGNGNIKQFASSESVTNPTLRPTLDIHYSTTTLPPAVSLSAPAEQ